jgi:hypothetical protein
MPSLLTVTDTVEVLAQLGVTLSARQVRYLNLAPAGWVPGPKSGRLYGPVEVAMLVVYAELLARCTVAELSRSVARLAVRYRDTELRRALVRGTPRYVVFNAVNGVVALSDTPGHGAVELLGLLDRVRSAVRAYRVEYEEVWTGAEYVEPEELVEALA